MRASSETKSAELSDVKPAKSAESVDTTWVDVCCDDIAEPIRFAEVVTATATLPGDDTIYKVTEIFSALADSTRLKILSSLMGGELCVCEMQEVCGVSQSAVSHQLRLLRDRGLVRSRREGQRSNYRLADEHVSQLIQLGIEHALEGGR